MNILILGLELREQINFEQGKTFSLDDNASELKIKF